MVWVSPCLFVCCIVTMYRYTSDAAALAPRKIDAKVGAFSDGSPRRSNFPRRRPQGYSHTWETVGSLLVLTGNSIDSQRVASTAIAPTSPTASARDARSSTLHPALLSRRQHRMRSHRPPLRQAPHAHSRCAERQQSSWWHCCPQGLYRPLYLRTLCPRLTSVSALHAFPTAWAPSPISTCLWRLRAYSLLRASPARHEVPASRISQR